MSDIIQLLNDDVQGERIVAQGMVTTILVNEGGHSYLKSVINWEHPKLKAHLALCKMKRDGLVKLKIEGDAVETFDIPQEIYDMIVQNLIQKGVNTNTERHKELIKMMNTGELDMFRCTKKRMRLRG